MNSKNAASQQGNCVSVVLSSYNGEKYIEDQLLSLLNQTRPPDEVLIVDDCSQDSTVQIITNFIDCNGLANWSIRKNEKNVGWRENFRSILLEASGEYVFPCDQDDIWHPDKIRTMLEIAQGDNTIDVLACTVKPFYEQGASQTRADRSNRNGSTGATVYKHPLNGQLLHVRRPGCAYCVRRDFIHTLKPYWNTNYPYDGLLFRLAAFKGSLWLLDRQLVDYRRHSGNAVGRDRVNLTTRMKQIGAFFDDLDLLESFAREHGFLDDEHAKLLAAERKWQLARLDYLLGKNRLTNLARMIAGGKMYASGLMLAADISLGVFRKLNI